MTFEHVSRDTSASLQARSYYNNRNTLLDNSDNNVAFVQRNFTWPLMSRA